MYYTLRNLPIYDQLCMYICLNIQVKVYEIFLLVVVSIITMAIATCLYMTDPQLDYMHALLLSYSWTKLSTCQKLPLFNLLVCKIIWYLLLIPASWSHQMIFVLMTLALGTAMESSFATVSSIQQAEWMR